MFVVAGTTGTAGAGNRVIAITMGNSTPARFYCELFDDTLSTSLKLTYTFDGTVYMIGGQAPAVTQLPSGSGRFSMATTASAATCGTTWHGEALATTSPIPAITVERLLLYAENVEATFDYFVQIHTDE